MKIFINPGHAPNGNPDPGAVNSYTGLRESDVAANVGSLVCGYLNNVGIETVMLQHDSLSVICRAAEGCDYFVSIHCNSAASPQAHGTETWYYGNSATGARLANAINDQIVNSLGTADRGIKSSTGLYVLRNTSMPAVLVEMAFISNDSDVVLLTERQDELARAIARGITDFFL